MADYTETTYEKAQPSIWAVGTKGGFITGLVLALFSLLVYIIDSEFLRSGTFSTIVSIISLVIGIVLTHKAFKDQGNGFMTYGQGLGLGSVLGIVAGAVSGIVSALYLAFVDSSFLVEQLDKARIKLEDQGMPDAQIDQAMAMTEWMLTPVGILLFGILGTLFYAFIFSLIISIFTKRNNPQLEY